MNLMRKIALLLLLIYGFFQIASINRVLAADAPTPTPDLANIPITCGCPPELDSIYLQQQNAEKGHDVCIASPKGEYGADAYETFKKDPVHNHLWVEDATITAQGKADERARQFIYWVLTHPALDNNPVLVHVWAAARNVAYFFVLIIGAIMGLGIIINRRSNFSSSVKVWPSIWKILLVLLYISFSATIVITLIQLSEVLMKFFIENLGGKDLFQIYFSGTNTESSYLNFVGCRDLNIRVQEQVGNQLMLAKITNITYYVMGGMILLRKVLLWFLLFASPFLGILIPFVFIRNIGWIWIGVFLQWIFYGPLLALFLGGLAAIWHSGIPFPFDFSRVNQVSGYVYPTATDIAFAGPAQNWMISDKVTNNLNYIDTYAEYIITLLMLWAVTFFPWWLLRIFRDYCCDAINASKNILMSMYDQMRGGPQPSAPTPTPAPTNIGVAMKIPQSVQIPIKVKLETMEEIKKTKTEDITRSLNIKASTLTDVAHFETNKELNKTVNKNINYLQNPTQAETATERQKYMNIRTELFNRAVKDDVVAKQVLTSISSSHVEQVAKRQEMLKTISQMVPVTKLEQIKIKTNDIDIPVPTAKLEQVKLKTGEIKVQIPVKTPEKSIEQIIPLPPTVPIEEYEQVKRMWKEQYEKGEVPTTENIKSREAWVDQDIVFITNTLNKLFSSDEKIKQAGLDDVGYILPIFLVNNLKGDQLVVYLKAKVEAAKEVKEMKEKEKEITEKLTAEAAEEFATVAKPKEQKAEKTMEMKEEIKDEVKPEETKPEAEPSENGSKPPPDQTHQP